MAAGRHAAADPWPGWISLAEILIANGHPPDQVKGYTRRELSQWVDALKDRFDREAEAARRANHR